MTGRAGRDSFTPRGAVGQPPPSNPQVEQERSQPHVVSKPDLQSLCRVCGKSCQDGVNTENDLAITSMLFKHLNIKVVPGDGLPHQLCKTCSTLLKDWDSAVNTCQTLQLYLLTLIKDTEAKTRKSEDEDLVTLQNTEDENMGEELENV